MMSLPKVSVLRLPFAPMQFTCCDAWRPARVNANPVSMIGTCFLKHSNEKLRSVIH